MKDSLSDEPNDGNGVAVILAAGPASAAFGGMGGNVSAAMVSVGGRPVIHRSLGYLKQLGYKRVIVGCREGEHRMRKFLQQAFGRALEIAFVEVPGDHGPGGTLLRCLMEVGGSTPVVVILGDTLFRLPKGCDRIPQDCVLVGRDSPNPKRWCYAVSDPAGLVTRLIDKPEIRPEEGQILIGVYSVGDCADGLRALRAKREGERLEIADFLAPYVAKHSLRSLDLDEWYDCGHIDSLAGSRRRVLATREFNALQFDEVRGTITKRSRHVRKLIDEINYYRLIPPDLQAFFPRVLDFSIAQENPYLTMEYYGYPTLSELWVFGDFEEAFWRRPFARIRSMLDCFGECGVPVERSVLRDFHGDKTFRRVREFAMQGEAFADLVTRDKLIINGREEEGWPRLEDSIRQGVEDLAESGRLCVMHGDLCFANILFDPISEAMKCLDVRGSFAGSGIYGDPRYDLAKLLHSIHGAYDFMIHDMYASSWKGAVVDFELYLPQHRSGILGVFKDVFGGMAPMRDVQFIEGLLFVSMCALHSDHPARQVTMFARGIELLNQWKLHEDLY